MSAETRIVIAGDWHANATWGVRVIEASAAQGIKRILHVGDFGAAFPCSDSSYEQRLSDACVKHDVQVDYIPGNHDPHPYLNALPLDDEGFAPLVPGIRFIPRSHRFKIGGRTFGGLGGAFSIDYQQRTAGVDWWPEEQVHEDDVAKLGTKSLDVLLTHDAPVQMTPHSPFRVPDFMELQSRISRRLISQAVKNTEPALVFCGHWHQRRTEQIPHVKTVAHILDREFSTGNAVVLDLATLTIQPLQVDVNASMQKS